MKGELKMKKGSKLLMVGLAVALVLPACAQQKKSAKAGTGLQRIHFDFDKSSIKPEFESVLQSNAAWAQSHSRKKVSVEGHCDERGSNEYNVALGDRRANVSKNYLITLGVSTDRLSTVSYGEEKGVATCHDESCWWQNRRAEFVAQ